MTDPYRKTQALVPVALHEAATCHWCRWSGTHPQAECSHPVSGGPSRLYCKDANPRGQCVHFSPSMLTRMLRRVRLRAPAMVDPGVWDPSRWGPFSRLKPTAHAPPHRGTETAADRRADAAALRLIADLDDE